MTLKIKHFVFLILMLSFSGLFAQSGHLEKAPSEINMVVIGKHSDGKIILRWAPRNYSLWQAANTGGYVIDRYDMNGNQIDLTSERRLTPNSLKPLTIEEWKAQFAPENKFAALAVHTLYGDTEDTGEEGYFNGIVGQHIQQSNLFGFGQLVADANREVALAMALRYEDENVNPNQKYVYRIHCPLKIKNAETDTAWVLIRPDRAVPVPKVNSLTAEELEKEVKLTWKSDENMFPPSGYYIDSSTDGGQTWTRLNDMPHIAMKNAKDPMAKKFNNLASFSVKLEENYVPVQYRILAFNTFAELSETGKIITAMGRDRTAPPQARIKNPRELDGALLIEWDMPENCEPLKGFAIGHSNNSTGPFLAIHHEVLPPDSRNFLDKDAANREQNYYIVSAIDTAGNISNSLPVYSKLIDTIPPEKVTELVGKADTNGLMTLTWKPSKAEDLMGYNVWFSNHPDHEFTQINGEPITTDTFTQILELNTLTEEIYYQVVAADINFNISERSDVLIVKKPDIVPPVAPQIHSVEASENGVLISWHNSPSKDIESHQILRRKSGELEWEIISEIKDLSQKSYSDNEAQAAVLYEYHLTGIDDDGLVSPHSNVVNGRVYHPSKKEGITELTAEKIKNEGLIKLSIQHSLSDDFSLYLYRAQNDGKLRLYRSLTAQETEFSDRQVYKKNKYRYAVKVMYATGSVSDMSEEAVVSF